MIEPSPDVHDAAPSDIPAIAELRRNGGWSGGAGAEVMARYLAGEHHPQHALRPRVILVAEAGGQLVGFIAGHRTTRFECDGEWQWLFVAPPSRGTGVADRLFASLAAWFAEHDAARVCVNVEPGNHVARRFYARHGATELNAHWMLWDDVGRSSAHQVALGR